MPLNRPTQINWLMMIASCHRKTGKYYMYMYMYKIMYNSYKCTCIN